MKKFYLENNVPAKSPESDNASSASKVELPQSFNIEDELKKIRAEYHGQEGLDKIKELKETWLFQKKGLVEIQNKVIEDIYSNSENFEAEAFFNGLQNLLDKYLLSPDSRLKIKNALRLCEDRISIINFLKKKALSENGEVDPRKMFNLVFQFEPQGEVKCLIEPLCLYFRVNNDKDFENIVNCNFLRPANYSDDPVKNIKSYGAMKLNKSWHRNLSGGLIIESPTNFNRPNPPQNILQHERRHVFNDFVFKFHFSDEEFAVKNLDKETSEEDSSAHLDFMDNVDIEKNIKDEIIAYFEYGFFPKIISKILLKDKTIYEGGLDYNYHRSGNKEMSYDYIEMVQNGIIAIANLMRAGYSNKEAQGLLVFEPLLAWPKISDRIIGRVRSDEEKERDIKENISKVIIKKKNRTIEKINSVGV
jgi:hypothetical protein